MIKVHFKSKGETIKAKIPSTWEEVTVKQFMALEHLDKPLEILASVMDKDLSFIQNTRTNLRPIMDKMLELFNDKPPTFDTDKPQGFGLLGKRVRFPRDIDNMLFGCVSQITELQEDGLNKNLLKIAGIAIQPVIDGEFIEDKQAYYSELIGALPIVEVFPELFFFAEKLKKFKRYGSIDLMRST